MSTTATDQTIEELEQLVEIEEAGYTVVKTTHRQTYISGLALGPWYESWHVRPTELRSGLAELPEAFASKAAALTAARKLIQERRAAGAEMFGVVSPETKNAINEARGRAAGFRVEPAAGAWQLLQGDQAVGSIFPSPATCWKLAADILDRQERGEADPLMAMAERAQRDRATEVRIREARIPAGAADLTFDDIAAEGEHNARALTTLREYVKAFSTQGVPRHLIVTGCSAIGGSVRLSGALVRELCEAGFRARYVNSIQCRTTPGWRLSDDRIPAELAEADVVILDLLSAPVSGGGSPLLNLICARDKAHKPTVLVASQGHAETRQAMELEVSYLEKLGAEVVEFRAAEHKSRPGKSVAKSYAKTPKKAAASD